MFADLIEFDDHRTLIEAWKLAGKPLSVHMTKSIISIAEDMKRLGLQDEWVIFPAQCRICNYIQNVICPAANDLDNQQCSECGEMTLMPQELPEEIKDWTPLDDQDEDDDLY